MQTEEKQITLVGRVLVDGEERLRDYKNGIADLLAAIDLTRRLGISMDFGIKLTIPRNSLTEELKNEADEVTRRVMGNIWLLYDVENRGPGISFMQIVFNPTFLKSTSVIMSYDPDNGIIGTEDSLIRYYELSRKVLVDEALLGVGSRDHPVRLAKFHRNSHLREIHELYHSLTIRSERLKVDEDIFKATQSYKEIGESISGFFALNLHHPRYHELAGSVLKYAQIADFTGFAAEYYTAIKSSTLGNIATRYITTKENPIYGAGSEADEFEKVKRLISYQTLQLGKTDVREMLYRTLKNRRNIDLLSRFYNRDDVELVGNLMFEALEIVR